MPGDVLYYGHIFNASGYATGTRGFILALHEAGYRVRVVPISHQDDVAGILTPSVRQTMLNLRHTPIDLAQALCIQAYGADAWQMQTGARRVVGRTMFETDRLPATWPANCNGVHEIWVPSRFNVESFTRAGVDPSKFRLVPEGVDTQRFHLGLPPLPLPTGRSYNFLSIFDWQFRKGWDVLLRAYLKEFHPAEDVALVLKIYQYNLPGRNIPAEIARFAAKEVGVPLTAGPPVIILQNYVSDDDMPRLYSAADAFVLPSRGEGWGRPMMEAMACGLPTIATNWGGQLEFMNEQNSYLIPSSVGPVSALNDIPVFSGHHWAEPNVQHLRHLMRYVFTDRAEARARGARAHLEVSESLNLGRVHQIFLQEVERALGS